MYDLESEILFINIFISIYFYFHFFLFIEADLGAVTQSVTVKPTGCGFDPHSRRWNIYLNLYFYFFPLVSRQIAALSSATQHAMPPESGRKWGTECSNNRFPLPTLLCAGYSMRLIFISSLWHQSTQRTKCKRDRL